ncbi:MAG: 50S ribosomal protein L10 [Anaplasmataceae bacterium]|nr:50S ribosomal protein L10 [Candidatus Heimdallarchaeota archaeon]MDH5796419.1 50S ribosomal protein L10 [Anaplasmataceae bacterium]
MDRNKKELLISRYRGYINRNQFFILADIGGLKGMENFNLRKLLYAQGIEVCFVKNNLARIVFNDNIKVNLLINHLSNSTVLLCANDLILLAKVVIDLKKMYSKLEFKIGIANDSIISDELLENYAKIPSLDKLYIYLVRCLSGGGISLLRTLSFIKDKDNNESC